MTHGIEKIRKRWMPAVSVGMLALLALLLLYPEQAHAATTGGGLPWEAPINTVVNSLTGPVAYGMCVVGFVLAVYRVVTQHEFDTFVKGMIAMCLGGAVLMASKGMVTTLFGGAGALIGR